MARSRTVLIAGAGIGGLSAALALAKAGFRAVIFERAAQIETAGAGIQLSPNATRALQSFGALDAVHARAVEPNALIVANGLNRAILANAQLRETMREKFGVPYLVCMRADLQQALYALAADNPDIEINLGASVTDFASHSRGVTVLVEQNRKTTEHPAIALIGADGIRSALRKKMQPALMPVHSGMAAWRAIVPVTGMPEDLRTRDIRVWLGPAAHLVHYPVGDGSEINIVAVAKDSRASETWGEEAAAEELMPAFARWSEAPRAVLASAEQFRRWPLFELPAVSRAGSGCTTLLGDAAHAVLPFIAQGAALAIEDAVALAKHLRNTPDPEAALRAYEAERAPRTRAVQIAARRVGRAYHLTAPWWHARDLVMERLGGDGLIERNRWIYGA